MAVPGPLKSITYHVFQRPKFCCCLPVRVCVIISSLLVFILAALLSIVLWFEVASTPTLTNSERADFIGAGIVETFLALICAIGFIGALAHKQLFATIYCVGLWIHSIIHLGVFIFVLSRLLRASRADGVVACEDAIRDPAAQQQCLNLLHLVTGIFAGVAGALIALEIYSAIVATRFVFATREKKRLARQPPSESDKAPLVRGFVRYTDADGNTVYDSHFYPPTQQTRYSRLEDGAEEFDPQALYDPFEARSGDSHEVRRGGDGGRAGSAGNGMGNVVGNATSAGSHMSESTLVHAP